MSRFTVTATPLSGLLCLERQQIADERGFLSRLFCQDELQQLGWTNTISQINQSVTVNKGTVRGMHYQVAPHTETKLVTCLHGEVWDVVVDLRPESPSFLQWHSELLSALNHRSLLIPAGFAHGFQTLTNDVTLIYCHSDSYQPQSERGLHPKDPRIAIEWPLDISQISERDSSQPWLTPDFNGVTL